jgi:hypothetical protein
MDNPGVGDMSRKLTGAVALAIALASCQQTAAPRVNPCDGSINVSVALGAQPTFAWAPACGISGLTVTALPTNTGEQETVVWGITASEQYPVGPPITYGIKPRFADLRTGPQALVSGRTYRVTVRYTVGGDVVTAGGSLTFIR